MYYLILRWVHYDKLEKKGEKIEYDESHDSPELQRLAQTVANLALPLDAL